MQTCKKCLEQIHPQALRCKWCGADTPYYYSEKLKLRKAYFNGSARDDKIFTIVFWVIGISLYLWWLWEIW